jgi:hypothetical protein
MEIKNYKNLNIINVCDLNTFLNTYSDKLNNIKNYIYKTTNYDTSKIIINNKCDIVYNLDVFFNTCCIIINKTNDEFVDTLNTTIEYLIDTIKNIDTNIVNLIKFKIFIYLTENQYNILNNSFGNDVFKFKKNIKLNKCQVLKTVFNVNLNNVNEYLIKIKFDDNKKLIEPVTQDNNTQSIFSSNQSTTNNQPNIFSFNPSTQPITTNQPSQPTNNIFSFNLPTQPISSNQLTTNQPNNIFGGGFNTTNQPNNIFGGGFNTTNQSTTNQSTTNQSTTNQSTTNQSTTNQPNNIFGGGFNTTNQSSSIFPGFSSNFTFNPPTQTTTNTNTTNTNTTNTNGLFGGGGFSTQTNNPFIFNPPTQNSLFNGFKNQKHKS